MLRPEELSNTKALVDGVVFAWRDDVIPLVNPRRDEVMGRNGAAGRGRNAASPYYAYGTPLPREMPLWNDA